MRFFLVLAVFLFTLPTLVSAKCNGRDLLASQSPQMLADLEKLASRHPYAKGRYFQVTKGGKSSYFIGTLHFDDPQTRRIPKFFRDKITTADGLLVEIEMQEAAEVLIHFLSNPEMILSKDPKQLERLFSKEEYNTIVKTLVKRKIPRQHINKLEPWFIANILQDIPCTTGRGRILDREIIAFAEKRGVPVRGLETKEDLIPLLSNPSRKDAVKNIKIALANLEYGPDLATTVKNLYMRGEIAKIVEFGYAFARRDMDNAEVARIAAKFEQEILVGRNKAWMRNLLPELAKGNRVVAVGAGHLYGQSGLLRLLERRGYSVQRLSLN